MNKYKEIKKILNNEEVIQRYLGYPEKHNSTGLWYKSPFRKEKTASFCVSNNKGIHDFGDNTHYDIISFVQKYFNTTPYQALEILCNDFNINYTNNEYETKKMIKRLKQKREEDKQIKEKIDTWFNQEIQKVCDEIKINRRCLAIYKESANFEVLSILYDEQIKLGYYFELLFNATERDKEKLYLMNH